MRKTDFFLSYKNFYMRLKDDYVKHGYLIIAYDFDDTISNWSGMKYPEAAGWTHDKVIKLLKEWRDYGKFILFTARSAKEALDEAVNFVVDNNIPLTTINENIPGIPFGNSAKVYYNILLDDKAGLGWPYKALRRLLREIKEGKLYE